MANDTNITPELLRKLLRYEPETGKLFSKKTGREVFTNIHHSGYLKGAIKGKTLTAHRVCMALQSGVWPIGEVDHLNGCKSDNRLENLRVGTKSLNQRNARKRCDNTSGRAGVNLRKNGKWQAYLSCNGRRQHLGSFETREEAIAARLHAQAQHGYTDRHGS